MELSKQEMELYPLFPVHRSKNFFYNMFCICSKGIEIDFQNRNWNYQTGSGIISPISRAPIKKLLLQNVFICFKGFKIDFQNRKWNHPNRKWNYFSHFLASNEKTPFTKYFSFDPRVSKIDF